jgi:hypothetical protein
MNRKIRLWLLIALVVVMPAIAIAGNGINGISTQVVSQWKSAAIKAIVTGDDDSNAVIRIKGRVFASGNPFDTLMVMVRRIGFGPNGQTQQATGNVYEGRILFGDPNTPFEFFIEGIDPGGNFSTAPQTVFFFAPRQMTTTGPIFYVDQGRGVDTNDGTLAYPFKTINAAKTALAASTNHGVNGGILIAPGEYHERLDFGSANFPVDGGPWFIEGDGTNRDSTIICGANQWMEKGYYAPGKAIKWLNTNQDSTWKAYIPAATGPGDSLQQVILGWAELIHRKTTLKGVLDDSTWVSNSSSSSNYGELSGWIWQNDTLYVKRRSGKSPQGMVLHCGYLDNLINIGRKNVRIANLTVRYSGGTRIHYAYSADPSPDMQGSGIAGGLLGTCDGAVIDSCTIYGCNQPAVYLVKGAGGGTSNNCSVTNCHLDGLRFGVWHYSASKSREYESANQIEIRGTNTVCDNNLIENVFNGIGMDAGDPTDSGSVYDAEITNNVVRHTSDDAIELDDSHAINVLVMDNWLHDNNSCFSLAPIWDGGPIFILRNKMTDFHGRGMKGSGNVGDLEIVGNTITSTRFGAPAVDYAVGGIVENTHYVNNILGSNNQTTILMPATGGASNTFNFDVLANSASLNIFRYQGTDWTLTGMQVFGQETNGNQTPLVFADSTHFNWLPIKQADWWNTGRRWTGLNTTIGGILYFGSAPDKGAIERTEK